MSPQKNGRILIPETEALVCPGSGGRALEKCVTATTHCNSTLQEEQHTAAWHTEEVLERAAATTLCNSTLQLQQIAIVWRTEEPSGSVRQHVATVHCNCKHTLCANTLQQYTATANTHCSNTLVQHAEGPSESSGLQCVTVTLELGSRSAASSQWAFWSSNFLINTNGVVHLRIGV